MTATATEVTIIKVTNNNDNKTEFYLVEVNPLKVNSFFLSPQNSI